MQPHILKLVCRDYSSHTYQQNRKIEPMKYKFAAIMIALAGVLIARTDAGTITFSFQENGSNVALGNTSTFTEGGYSLTASAFLTSGKATGLYAKQSGGDETGLGTTFDPSGNHEVVTNDFIQLTLPTTPHSTFDMIFLSSVQNGESAKVYFTTSPGTLSGATLIQTVANSDGFVAIPAGDRAGFIDITAGRANVLLSGAQITTTAPDSGSTLALLGIALSGIEGVRRMIRTRRA